MGYPWKPCEQQPLGTITGKPVETKILYYESREWWVDIQSRAVIYKGPLHKPADQQYCLMFNLAKISYLKFIHGIFS